MRRNAELIEGAHRDLKLQLLRDTSKEQKSISDEFHLKINTANRTVVAIHQPSTIVYVYAYNIRE